MERPAGSGKPDPSLEEHNSLRMVAGEFLLQVGLPDGALANLARPEHLIEPQPRNAPLTDLPPRLSFWLDREREIALVAEAFQSPFPGRFEINGSPGAGKTALLRYLAYHPLAAGFRDGVVFLPAGLQPLPDLLQTLFEVFCQFPVPFRPDEPQVRGSLQDLQALILLDEVNLTVQEIDELTGALPGCTFFLACSEGRLWERRQSLDLAGLPTDAALSLFERRIGRILFDKERTEASALVAALQGHPLLVLQAAALAQPHRGSVSDIFDLQSLSSVSDFIQKQLLESLTESERLIVFGLAVLDGVSAAPGHLAALTGLSDVVRTLDGLSARGLVQVAAGRYSLAGGMDQRVLNTWNLAEWKSHTLVYYTRWVETQPLGSELLLEETYLLLGIMKWAAGMGRWQELLRLVRGLEGTLALAGRWEAWRQALQMGLEAARALGGQAAESWALHQLGTRLLCLGQTGPARAALIQALRLRQSLGDRAGELATQHNLTVLLKQRVGTGKKPADSSSMDIVFSLEKTSPVPVTLSSTEMSILPGEEGKGTRSPTKTPSRLTRPLLVVILLFALFLFVPAAFLSLGYFRPVETADPPSATSYVLVVETPGITLYLPLVPNQYPAPGEPAEILPVTVGATEPPPAYYAPSTPSP